MRLFTPGPTPIPPEVQTAMSQPLLYHKSSEFEELMRSVVQGLQYVFSTKQLVLPLSSSATGTAEAVISSVHKAGETVLVLNNGRFAGRWRTMLELFGIKVINEDIQWGESPSAEQLEKLLLLHTNINAVWIVHCETSTGAVANIKDLIKTIRLHSDALVCVDGVSSVGAIECKMDEWGIDVLISCSQKALMTPPGLGLVSLSERAWIEVERKKPTSYYFDLLRIRTAVEKNKGVFTPAIGLIMGLNASLNYITNVGLAQVFARHLVVATIIRTGMKDCNLPLLARYPSNSLTVIKINDSIEIIRRLKHEFGVIVADGQDSFSGNSMRIGHLGYIFEDDALYFVDCMKKLLL
ncbi:MAG: alanine--glyoxylate aminotransferase family protein [Bacteroidetes bacterium]|nr:alanine--glyoxylate aminotransferase family protein [Bacteroidota bacterium]